MRALVTAVVILVALSTATTVIAEHQGWWPGLDEAGTSSGASSATGTTPAQEEGPRPAQLTEVKLVSEEPSQAAVGVQRAEPLGAPGQTLASVLPQPTGAQRHLPATKAERSADGLPISGMLCSVDGGVLQCGACRSDSDCPAGEGCVANRQTRRFECLPSECEEDSHCFPGLACRAVTTGTTGPLIRRCVPEGVRREGETCDILFTSQSGACREGLLCHRGTCSRPCVREDAASCPKGHVCEDGLNGPACFPDCRVSGCATGQQCKQLSDLDYQCLSAVKGDCPESACSAGERCNMRVLRGRGVFWCAALCSPLQADSCPEGQVCGRGSPTISTCFRRCEPGKPNACGEGWQCTTINEEMSLWGCEPSSP
jgi:hypothetical protein